VQAVVWKTKDWTKVCEVLTVPDFVTRVAVFPERDLVVERGMKVTSLLRLRSGEQVADLGTRKITFAAFDQSGALIFTDSREKFAVWDLSGKQYCSGPDVGNHIALSANGRWLAAAPVGGGTTVMVWNLQKALDACGIPDSMRVH
jgi:hypothetical protein